MPSRGAGFITVGLVTPVAEDALTVEVKGKGHGGGGRTWKPSVFVVSADATVRREGNRDATVDDVVAGDRLVARGNKVGEIFVADWVGASVPDDEV